MEMKKLNISKVLIFEIVIFLLAFAIRYYYFSQLTDSDTFFDESRFYQQATSLLEGKPFAVLGPRPTHILTISFILSLFGKGYYFPRLIQIILSSLSVVLIYRLGKKVFNPFAGIVASLLAIFYTFFITLSGHLFAANNMIFLLILQTILLVKLSERINLSNAILIGIVFALAALQRTFDSIALISLCLVSLFFIIPEKKLKYFLIILGVTIISSMLIISPFVLRNQNLKYRGYYNWTMEQRDHFAELHLLQKHEHSQEASSAIEFEKSILETMELPDSWLRRIRNNFEVTFSYTMPMGPGRINIIESSGLSNWFSAGNFKIPVFNNGELILFPIPFFQFGFLGLFFSFIYLWKNRKERSKKIMPLYIPIIFFILVLTLLYPQVQQRVRTLIMPFLFILVGYAVYSLVDILKWFIVRIPRSIVSKGKSYILKLTLTRRIVFCISLIFILGLLYFSYPLILNILDKKPPQVARLLLTEYQFSGTEKKIVRMQGVTDDSQASTFIKQTDQQPVETMHSFQVVQSEDDKNWVKFVSLDAYKLRGGFFSFDQSIQYLIDKNSPLICGVADKEYNLATFSYEFQKIKPSLFWDFNQDGSLQGWRNTALLDLISVENGVAHFISRGARDPILLSPSYNLAINTEKSKVILIRMKQNHGSCMEVIWYKEEDGKPKDYVTQMGLISDNEFHLYYIPVGDNPGWSGRIDHIRIDPVNCESELYIDFIAIPEVTSKTKEDLAAEIRKKIYLNLPDISRESTIYLYLEHLNQQKDIFGILCKELPVQYGDSSLNVKSLNEIENTQISNNSLFLAYSNGDLIDFTDRIPSVVWETQEKIKKYQSVRWDYKRKDVSSIYVDVEKIFKMTKEYGITTLAYFMIGNPTETRKQIMETFAFAKKIKPDYVHFAVTTPFPATDLYRLGLEKRILKTDYWQGFACNPRKDFVPKLWEENLLEKELKKLLNDMYKRFYLRPSYIFKEIREISSRQEFRRKIKAGLSLLRLNH